MKRYKTIAINLLLFIFIFNFFPVNLVRADLYNTKDLIVNSMTIYKDKFNGITVANQSTFSEKFAYYIYYRTELNYLKLLSDQGYLGRTDIKDTDMDYYWTQVEDMSKKLITTQNLKYIVGTWEGKVTTDLFYYDGKDKGNSKAFKICAQDTYDKAFSGNSKLMTYSEIQSSVVDVLNNYLTLTTLTGSQSCYYALTSEFKGLVHESIETIKKSGDGSNSASNRLIAAHAVSVVSEFNNMKANVEKHAKALGLTTTLDYDILSADPTFKAEYQTLQSMTATNDVQMDLNSMLSGYSFEEKNSLFMLLDKSNIAAPVSPIYIWMFASTAIYTPLQNLAGDQQYLTTIGTKGDAIVKTYQYFGSNRKPLMKAQTNDYDQLLDPSAGTKNFDASVVTLKDIRDSVMKNEKAAYVVETGKMTAETDTDYIKSQLEKQNGSGSSSSGSTNKTTNTNNNTTNTNNNNTTNSSTTNNNTTNTNNTNNNNTTNTNNSTISGGTGKTSFNFIEKALSLSAEKVQDFFGSDVVHAVNAATTVTDVKKSLGLIFGFIGDSVTAGMKEADTDSNEYYAVTGHKVPTESDSDKKTYYDDVKAGNAKSLVLLFGYNDINSESDVSGFITRYTAYINYLKANKNDAKIYVCTIPPCSGSAASKNDAYTKANDAIKTMVSQVAVNLIDTTTIITDPSAGRAADGIHWLTGNDYKPLLSGIKTIVSANTTAGANDSGPSGIPGSSTLTDVDKLIAANTKNKYSGIVFSSGFFDNAKSSKYSNYYYKLNLLQMELYNLFKNNSIKDNLLQSPVYMDFLGDIVLQDNTILIPGVANYAIYNYKDSSTPIPVLNRAFLNSYPRLSNPYNTSSYIVGGDENKFIFTQGTSVGSFKDNIAYGNTNYSVNISLLKPKSVLGKAASILESFKAKFTDKQDFKFNDKYTAPSVQLLGAPSNPGDPSSMSNIFVPDDSSSKNMYLANNKILYNNVRMAFSNLSDASLDPVLAQANYYYFTSTGSYTQGKKLNSLITDKGIVANVIIPAFNGIVDTTVYQKNFLKDYKSDMDDLSRIITATAKAINGVYTKISGLKGVIGFQDVYQNRLLGSVVLYGFQYGSLMVLGILVIFVLKFIKGEYTLPTTLILWVVTSVLVIGGFKYVPRYIPAFYNLVSNNLAHDMAMNAMLYNSEQQYYKDLVFDPYSQENRAKINDFNLTVYKLSDVNFDLIANIFSLNKYDANKPLTLDNLEIYQVGDELRINFSDLWKSVSVSGKMADKQYVMEVHKYGDTVYEYYMPYVQIMDSFVSGTLNNYTEVFMPEKRSFKYGDVAKDSFVCNSFVTSPLMVNYSLDSATMDKIRNKYSVNNLPLVDFLGLDKMLTSNTSQEAKETIWYKRAVKVKKDSPKLYENKIIAVNEKVRYFIFNNRELLRQVSDENFIKIVCMYATMEYDMGFSEPDNFIYPTDLNYGDVSMNDLFQIMIPKKENIYQRDNYDIVSYIAVNNEIPGLLLFAVNVALTYVNTMIMNWFYAVLYILFVIFLVVKLVQKNKLNPLMISFFRLSVILLAIYYLNVIFYYCLWSLLNDPMWKLILMILFNAVILDTFVAIFEALRSNVMDLGYGSLQITLAERWRSRINKVMGKIDNIYSKGNIFHRSGSGRDTADRRRARDRFGLSNLDNRHHGYYPNYGSYGSGYNPNYSSNYDRNMYNSNQGYQGNSDNAQNGNSGTDSPHGIEKYSIPMGVFTTSEFSSKIGHIDYALKRNSDGTHNAVFKNKEDYDSAKRKLG